MSDDGLLSQADIDALAGIMGGGGSDDGGSSGSGSSGGLDPEIVRPVLKLITEQASSVVTTIISKNVDFKLNALQNIDEAVVSRFLTDSLQVRVGFENDLQGDFSIIITKETTALLSDFMMMGDGKAKFEDDHMDALSELVNQWMGAVNTVIAAELDLSLSISQSVTTAFKPSAMISSPGIVGIIDLKIDGMEDVSLLFVFSESLVSSIDDKLGVSDSGSSAGEPANVGETLGGDAFASLGAFDKSAANFNALGASASLFDSTGIRALDMLMDIPLDLTIELGRTNLSIRRILELGPGSIVEMDRLAGEPVDILINDKVVAKGEVVVVDEYFGIRIVSLVTPEERIKFLK